MFALALVIVLFDSEDELDSTYINPLPAPVFLFSNHLHSSIDIHPHQPSHQAPFNSEAAMITNNNTISVVPPTATNMSSAPICKGDPDGRNAGSE